MFGYTKTLQTVTGMGSAALAAAVPYPRKPTQIARKGRRGTKNKVWVGVNGTGKLNIVFVHWPI